MPLQNYLQTSRYLVKLSSLGDIRESTANKHIVSSLLDIACDSESTVGQIYASALAAIAPRNPLVSIQGGTLPRASMLAGTQVGNFQLGMYAVTMAEWQGVRHWAIENGFDMAEGAAGGSKHPVTGVNWYDCVKWCNAKSVMEGLDPVYSVKGQEGYYARGEFGPEGSDVVIWYAKSGYRLPTEAEWEWAARGGRNSQGYKFAGSDNLDAVSWYCENSGGAAHAVGEKTANELGLYDMSGNVWEWCWDLKDPDRRVRGGCADGDALGCAVSFSDYYSLFGPVYRNPYFGLRLARSL
jgi:formylglycine-generating enzyme required for sulfatase activity